MHMFLQKLDININQQSCINNVRLKDSSCVVSGYRLLYMPNTLPYTWVTGGLQQPL